MVLPVVSLEGVASVVIVVVGLEVPGPTVVLEVSPAVVDVPGPTVVLVSPWLPLELAPLELVPLEELVAGVVVAVVLCCEVSLALESLAVSVELSPQAASVRAESAMPKE